MKQAATTYALSFQAERFHQQTRYHWMICGAQTPDELVSWGYSPTQEEAEMAAQQELNNLYAGLTRGGKVTSTVKAFTHRF